MKLPKTYRLEVLIAYGATAFWAGFVLAMLVK